jgi:hypothetical protein
MSKLTYGKGDVSVVVDDKTAALVRAVIDRVAPGIYDIFEATVRKVNDDAVARWPVGPHKPERQGKHSRDMIGWEMQIDPDGMTIRGRVFCTAAWAKYIKPKGLAGKSAFVTYFRKPMQAASKPLVPKIARAIAAGLGG